MAESEERYGMSKLEGASNFRTWIIQIKALLMERRLWTYVEESVELKNDPSDKEIEAHEHKLQSAYTKIIMSMSTPMVALCLADTTAKQVWKTLHEQFDKSTNLAKLRIKCKHMTTKLREGESAEQHVRVMKELTDRLAVMGSPVSEEDQAMVLLLSLPPSFGSLVSALAAPAKMDLATITNGILEHELRTSGDQEEDHALFGSANTTRRYPQNANGNPSHNTGTRKEFPCHGCGRVGHFIRDCPNTNGHRDSNQPRATQGPSKNRRPKFRNSKHKAKLVHESDEHDAIMFCVHENTYDKKRSDWIIDSGASSHMSWEREIFTTYKELNNSTVKVGDGRTLKVAGEGTVLVKVLSESRKPITLTMNRVLHVPEMSCNLMSVRQIAENGFSITFKDQQCRISDKRGRLVAKGAKQGILCILDGGSARPETVGEAHVATLSTRELWHNRLAHIGDAALDKLSMGKLATGIDLKERILARSVKAVLEGSRLGRPRNHLAKSELKENCKLYIVM